MDRKEVAAIPLVEERLAVAKRQVETEGLEVRISVEEREERLPVELTHDKVEVERVPRNVAVTDVPMVRLEGNVTIIPVVEEVMVVEKRLMLVEEIHVRRTSETTSEEVQLMVRSEQARIARHGADDTERAQEVL